MHHYYHTTFVVFSCNQQNLLQVIVHVRLCNTVPGGHDSNNCNSGVFVLKHLSQVECLLPTTDFRESLTTSPNHTFNMVCKKAPLSAAPHEATTPSCRSTHIKAEQSTRSKHSEFIPVAEVVDNDDDGIKIVDEDVEVSLPPTKHHKGLSPHPSGTPTKHKKGLSSHPSGTPTEHKKGLSPHPLGMPTECKKGLSPHPSGTSLQDVGGKQFSGIDDEGECIVCHNNFIVTIFYSNFSSHNVAALSNKTNSMDDDGDDHLLEFDPDGMCICHQRKGDNPMCCEHIHLSTIASQHAAASMMSTKHTSKTKDDEETDKVEDNDGNCGDDKRKLPACDDLMS
jgi:hypothetical protein